MTGTATMRRLHQVSVHRTGIPLWSHGVILIVVMIVCIGAIRAIRTSGVRFG